jgi:hypothetical protein
VVAAALVLAAVVWVLVNGPVEGPILLVVAPGHGLTVADLFSVAAVLLAVGIVYTGPRR